jgi:methionyl-tRNA formyltransferase
MNKKRKIAFFGSDEIALPCLNALLDSSESWEICGVLTQPDRRSGRGRKLRSNPIKKWSLEQGIHVKDPEIPGKEEVNWLKDLGAELTLVMAYGHILKDDLLEAVPCGCFNLHASLLPKYRGASPIETALAMGEKETGVTLMRVFPRMDAGPIVDSEAVSISMSDTGSDLRKKLGYACIPLIQRAMPNLLTGEFCENEQDEAEATYCRKLTKADGQIDFTLSAEEIDCRARAFTNWPGLWFNHNQNILKVGKLSIFDGDVSLKPGQRDSGMKDALVIGTGNNAIKVLELQKPGGKMVPVSDFLRGYALPEEITFSSPSGPLSLLC